MSSTQNNLADHRPRSVSPSTVPVEEESRPRVKQRRPSSSEDAALPSSSNTSRR